MKTEPFAAVGSWMRIHRRLVFLVWGLVALSLGVFAPRLEGSLSVVMVQVDNSQSLAARQLIDQNFGGLSSQSAVLVLHSDTLSDTDPAFAHSISTSQGALAAETAFGPALPPQTSPDGHTVMIQAGALVDPTEAVRAADRLSGDLQPISNSQVTVALTGAPAFWSDFNAVNRAGMQKAEIFTWPVTAVILVIAFGSLAAAGLPLALAAAGLVSAMGVLFGVTQLTNLSIWTLNFAMMFALALGIDYSLF